VSAINDARAALPNNDEHGYAYAGMTLRDWFAGQALAGISSTLAHVLLCRTILNPIHKSC
jgi:hypothetical protein